MDTDISHATEERLAAIEARLDALEGNEPASEEETEEDTTEETISSTSSRTRRRGASPVDASDAVSGVSEGTE